MLVCFFKSASNYNYLFLRSLYEPSTVLKASQVLMPKAGLGPGLMGYIIQWERQILMWCLLKSLMTNGMKYYKGKECSVEKKKKTAQSEGKESLSWRKDGETEAWILSREWGAMQWRITLTQKEVSPLPSATGKWSPGPWTVMLDSSALFAYGLWPLDSPAIWLWCGLGATLC